MLKCCYKAGFLSEKVLLAVSLRSGLGNVGEAI